MIDPEIVSPRLKCCQKILSRRRFGSWNLLLYSIALHENRYFESRRIKRGTPVPNLRKWSGRCGLAQDRNKDREQSKPENKSAQA